VFDPKLTSFGVTALILALCAAMSSCASVAIQSSEAISRESLKAIKQFSAESQPRVILRVTSEQPVVAKQGELFVPTILVTRETEMDAYYYSFGFREGVIIALPVAVIGVAMARIAEASIDARAQSAINQCSAKWLEFSKDGSVWANETFSRLPITQVLEDELRLIFAANGRGHLVAPVTVDKAWSYPDLANLEAGSKESEPALLVGDISPRFDWGLLMPGQDCGMQLTFEVQLYAMDMRPMSNHPLSAAKMVVAVRVSDPRVIRVLMDDPDLSREWFKRCISALATSIADVGAAK